MVSVMYGWQWKWVGGPAVGSSRAYAWPSEGWGVVRGRMEGTLTALHVVHEHVVLRNSPCELEVRIRDRAGGIGAAHDVALE